MSLKAKWQDWFDKTTEECFVQFEGERVRVQGIIKGTAPDFACQYKLTLTSGWVFREAEIQIKYAEGSGKQVFLGSDGNGKWVDYKNNRIEGLENAVDIDFMATPFTNTLPIKRLQLERGDSADITVAYISFPDLAITAEKQRYTCIEPMRLYRFESRDNDFTADISVDENGLVTDYPGLFKRV